MVSAIGTGYTYFDYTTATMALQIKDPPKDWRDATSVNIHYSAIEIHRTDQGDKAGWVKVGEEGWIDLSTVVDVAKTIGETKMDPGTYNLLRFEILEATVIVDGQTFSASAKSGKLNIHIENGGITLEGGKTSKLLIDIDSSVVGSKNSGYRIMHNVKAQPVG